MSFGKGGGDKTVETHTDSSPWGPAQDYLKDIFSRAQGLANRGLSYFPGSTVAAQSPYTLEAIQRQAGATQDPNSLTNAGTQQFGKTIAGDYLQSNPYLEGALKPALDQAQARVNSTFGAHGGNNFGSSAHADTLARTLADTALPYYAQNYQQERARQLNAAQLAPGMEAQSQAPLAGAGATQDAYQQAQINAEKARYDFGQMSPWQSLQQYQQGVAGGAAAGGSTIGSQPYYPPNPLMNLIGGGLGAMGIYGMGKNAGLWGTAGAGGLAGLGGSTLGSAGMSDLLPFLAMA